MTLSIVGRYNISDTTTITGGVQDLDNLDVLYFLANTGGVWGLYKFTWPDSIVLVVNLHAYLDGRLFEVAAISKDFSTLLGEMSADQHYCIATGKLSGGYIQFVDVNLSNGSVTTHTESAVISIYFSNKTYVGYKTDGTYFYSFGMIAGTGTQRWANKRLGENTGAVDSSDLNSISYVYWSDYEAFYGYADGRGWRSKSLNLSASSSEMVKGMIEPQEIFGKYDTTEWPGRAHCYFPQMFKGWDDNWLYGFGAGHFDAENDVLFYRKNVVTHQYQYVVLLDGAQMLGSNYDYFANSFDLWQTGDDSLKRRMFFAYAGIGFGKGKVFTSLCWPPAVDGSIVIDAGGEDIFIPSIHTANEYVYVLHFGGEAQGTCITKLLETELIAEEAEPSIGGIGARLLFKDKRVFFIGVPGYGKYLWWAQPMEPQTLDVGWDGFNTTVFDDEDNTSLNALDDNIYIGSQKGFIRLRGKSPDSWVLDQTLATTGPLSDKTSSITPFGLVYPRENGLWLFNGFTSALFFEKGKNLLGNVNWAAYERAFSLWDGRYYRLYYPSGTSTENDRELVIDLIGGIENARGTEGDRAATFGFADLTTDTIYLGDASGNLMTLGGTAAARPFSLTTKEYPCGAGLMEAGQFSALHYDIDLAGATLSIIPICDGVEKTAITITNTARTRSKVSLPKGNFYRMGFRFEVTTDKAVKFYDPWYIE